MDFCDPFELKDGLAQLAAQMRKLHEETLARIAVRRSRKR
jgi:hypothetical protein